MIDIKVIVSEDPTPAEAVTIGRTEYAALTKAGTDYSFEVVDITKPEASEACPEAASLKEYIGLMSEEEVSLLDIWEKRRLAEFEGLPVRASSLWNSEYDILTEAARNLAEKDGKILTPVVIIDGEVVSSGVAARPCELEKCIERIAKN